MEKKAERFNKYFNAFILIGMTVVTVWVTAVKMRDADGGRLLLAIAAVGSLAGVRLTSGRYGNAAMHLLYFLPMQFVGFVQWRRRGAAEGEQVQARRLDARRALIYSAVFLAGLVAAYIILCALDKTEAAGVVRWLVLMDAFSMMCNILGQLLMSTAYMEQWYFWIGVNIASIVMWVLTLRSTPDSDFAAIYIVKYSFYLLNSLNGLRIWMDLSRRREEGCLEM